MISIPNCAIQAAGFCDGDKSVNLRVQLRSSQLHKTDVLLDMVMTKTMLKTKYFSNGYTV